MIEAAIGWAIFGAVFFAVSAAILWLPFKLLPRLARRRSIPLAARLTLTAMVAFALWYILPIVVHGALGRAPH